MKIIRVVGPCANADCGCRQYADLKATDPGYRTPPFHEGCTCIVEQDYYRNKCEDCGRYWDKCSCPLEFPSGGYE